MIKNRQETIADIVAEMREGVVADGWMEQTLREFADRIEAAWKHSVPNCNRLGNVSKMREALINAYYAMLKFIKTPYAECDEMALALDGAIAALAAPPRNCDRPECATTKAAQDVWRKEDGGKTAYYEWLLATYTKGGTDGSK